MITSSIVDDTALSPGWLKRLILAFVIVTAVIVSAFTLIVVMLFNSIADLQREDADKWTHCSLYGPNSLSYYECMAE